MDPHFTIATNPPPVLTNLALNTRAEAFLGQVGESEKGVAILPLDQALAIAVKQSRSYQNNKETLYLAALSLTLARHQFTPLFSAGGDAKYAVQTQTATGLVPDPADPSKYIVQTSDNLVEQNQVNGSGNVRADWLIRDVGRITTAFTTDFLRFLTGDPRVTTSSQLGATFARPLLRNAGFKAEQEALIQAERDLLYAVREFVRFRKDFSVQIATAYYGVLGNRDAARNSFLNLENSRRTAERTRALATEGRATQSDLGRLEQQVLSAEAAWINGVRNYSRSLDEFKIQLGIPINTPLVLDDQELAHLKIQHPGVNEGDALTIALTARLDFLNLRDQFEDNERRVKLAVNRFLPQVDAVASASIDSGQKSHGLALPDPARYRWDAGLNVDLGLDRKAERNAYRSVLIATERSARALTQRHDEIEQQVRDSYRALEQAKRTYEISEIGVKLAQRRVEEQELLAQLGRAKAQDQVDAQNDLASSSNQRTQALVAHTIARLQFWDNLGILYIKENGQWKDIQNGVPK